MNDINQLQLLIDAVTRSSYIEVLVANANASQFDVPRQSKLDNSLIVGIQSYNVDHAAITPSQRANVANVVFNKSYLTLTDAKNNQFIEYLPLSAIEKIENSGLRYKLNYELVNFENSFITVPETTGLVINTNFFLRVDYVYLEDLKRSGINVDELLLRFK